MKKEFQDVIPKGTPRSIRNIPLPNGKHVEVNNNINNEVREPEYTFRGKPKRRVGIWLVALGAIIILGLSITWLFSKATVDLTMVKAELELESVLIAEKSNPEALLEYATVTIDDSAEKEVKGSGEKDVEIKATGRIIIFNENATAQKLIENTRFETKNGLIYRIGEAVTVPGKTGDVPGSIEATVTADKAGNEYNAGLQDFTIPGFKDDPKFETMYARSKTPLSGGALGKIPLVSEEDLAKSRTELQEKLRASLEEKVKAQIPKEFVLLQGASEISFAESEVGGSVEKATITEKGTLKAFVILKSKLVSYLASEAKVALPESSEIVIENNTAKITSVKETGDSLELAGSGNIKVTYSVDEEGLKEKIKGMEKTAAVEEITKYPGIEKVKIVVRPFWKGALPEDPKKINIKINN